jgi:hypothetical protein
MRHIIWLFAVVTLGGCGSAADGPPLAKVTGIVTLDGKPIEGATVIFQPKSPGPTSFGVTGPDGSFSIRTGSGRDGAAVGDHMVGVSLSMVAGAPSAGSADDLAPPIASEVAGTAQAAKASAGPRVVWLVPEKYSKPESSGLTATVPSGGLTDYKLDLKK